MEYYSHCTWWPLSLDAVCLRSKRGDIGLPVPLRPPACHGQDSPRRPVVLWPWALALGPGSGPCAQKIISAPAPIQALLLGTLPLGGPEILRKAFLGSPVHEVSSLQLTFAVTTAAIIAAGPH